jgi:Putative carbonic anhydrase
MRKLLHFDTPRDPYDADATLVWCFDARFSLPLRKFLKRSGIANADVIRIAGGAKSLADPSAEAARAFIADQIRTSVRLHGSKRIILMLHSDCGAYGGLANFGGDERFEADSLARDLQHAAAYVRQSVPNVPVECCFCNFEGVWAAGEKAVTGA